VARSGGIAMTAKRFAIIEAIEAAILTINGIAEVQINASGDPSRFPAIFITDTGHSPDVNSEPGATRYQMRPIVEGYVSGGDGKDATQKINALYLSVVNVIMADTELQTLCEEINEGELRVATVVLSKERRMGFELEIDIQFVADRENPAAA
jgi:hypothetical protein